MTVRAAAPAARTAPAPLRLGNTHDRAEQRAEQRAGSLLAASRPGTAAPPAGLPSSPGLPFPGGQPLAAADRSYFEPRLDRRLDAVRLHRGPAAQLAARSLGAGGFALNNDIAIAGADPGNAVLAHELAHVTDGETGIVRRNALGHVALSRHLAPVEVEALSDTELQSLYSFLQDLALSGHLDDPGFSENFTLVREVIASRHEAKAAPAAPPEKKPVPIPAVSDVGSPAQLYAAMDAIATLNQVASDEANAGIFEFQWEGTTHRITGVDAAKLRQTATDSIRTGLGRAASIAASARGLYEAQSQTDRDSWVIAPIIKFVGNIKDPGPVMLGLAAMADSSVAAARTSLAGGNYKAAAAFLVTAERQARQADKMSRAYWEKIIATGEMTVSALEVVRDVSFATVAVIAIVVSGGAALGVGGFTASAAGSATLIATATPVVAGVSEGLAKAAMGDKVDWGSIAIDAAIAAIMYRFGGPLAGKIGGGMTKMLVAQAGRTLAKEAIAKAVAGVIVGRGASIVQSAIKAIYNNATGRPVTWAQYVDQVGTMMVDPKQGLFDLVSLALGLGAAAKLRPPPGGPAPATPAKPPPAKPPATSAPEPEPMAPPAARPAAATPATAEAKPAPAAAKPAATAAKPATTAAKPAITAAKPAATDPAMEAAATKVLAQPAQSARPAKPAAAAELEPAGKPAAGPAEAKAPPAKAATATPDADVAAAPTVKQALAAAAADRQRLAALSDAELIAETRKALTNLAAAKQAGKVAPADLNAAERGIKAMQQRSTAKANPEMEAAAREASATYAATIHKDSYLTIAGDGKSPATAAAMIPGETAMTPRQLHDTVVATRGFDNSIPMGKGGQIMAAAEARIAQLKALPKPSKAELQELGRLERSRAISMPGTGGGPAGSGFNTYAIIQVVDAKGKLIAWGQGKYVGSLHAEEIAIAQLRQKLAGQNTAGASIVVVGDKHVCSHTCTPALQQFATDIGASSAKGYVYRRPVAQGSGLASEKTTARTAGDAAIQTKVQGDSGQPTPLTEETSTIYTRSTP
jgi:hypothetical protein